MKLMIKIMSWLSIYRDPANHFLGFFHKIHLQHRYFYSQSDFQWVLKHLLQHGAMKIPMDTFSNRPCTFMTHQYLGSQLICSCYHSRIPKMVKDVNREMINMLYLKFKHLQLYCYSSNITIDVFYHVIVQYLNIK